MSAWLWWTASPPPAQFEPVRRTAFHSSRMKIGGDDLPPSTSSRAVEKSPLPLGPRHRVQRVILTAPPAVLVWPLTRTRVGVQVSVCCCTNTLSLKAAFGFRAGSLMATRFLLSVLFPPPSSVCSGFRLPSPPASSL